MSFILHAVYIGPVIRMVRAREAIKLGLTKADLDCVCEVCVVSEHERLREADEKVCQASCDKKCFISYELFERKQSNTKCPLLEKFKDEKAFYFKRRCKAAYQLKEAAKNLVKPEDIPWQDDEDEAVNDLLSLPLVEG